MDFDVVTDDVEWSRTMIFSQCKNIFPPSDDRNSFKFI